MVSWRVILKNTDVLAIFIPHTNRHTKKTVTIILLSTEKRNKKYQNFTPKHSPNTRRNKKNYVYIVKYIQISSSDDSLALPPSLPSFLPSPPSPPYISYFSFSKTDLSRFPSRRWLGNLSHPSMG